MPARHCFSSFLLHRNALGQIPRLVHIQPPVHAGVICQQLKRYDCQAADKMCVRFGNIYREIDRIFDVIVSVTGVAGPDSPYEGKEVGLVYIGCNVKGKITVKEYKFKGDRTKVRECATTAALDLMRVCILKYVSETQFGM